MEPNRTLVIAEAGSNWRMGSPTRDLEMAHSLIDLAKEAGADAVKFQVFRRDTVYAAEPGPCPHLSERGISQGIGEVFRDLEMPYEMVSKLASYSERQGIEFMASFFSQRDFMAIEPFVNRHKIASPELHHPRLLELAVRSKKPTLLSTGISKEDEIEWAVDFFEKDQLTLLQCTVEYPTSPDIVNLQALHWLKEKFGCPVGLSDHSRDPIVAPVAAVAMGACVIEKHFTLHNRLVGPDHSWAVTGEEFAEMVEKIRLVEKMLGSGQKEIMKGEESLRSFSLRRLHAIRDIAKGEAFKEGENIAILRSGGQKQGIHARHLKKLDGKVASRDISKGVGVMEEDCQ